jgi:hypothetical protein
MLQRSGRLVVITLATDRQVIVANERQDSNPDIDLEPVVRKQNGLLRNKTRIDRLNIKKGKKEKRKKKKRMRSHQTTGG